jgi:hypothetical protein
MELRCANGILHGVVFDGSIEVSCKSRRCGKVPGVIVLHTFDLRTGKLLSTRLFKNPEERGENNGSSEPSIALRSS